MGRVIVVGSINQDFIVEVERFPQPGETLSGTDVEYGLGGKGANQAAASAHAGGETVFFGAVGDDAAGRTLREELVSHGVDGRFLTALHGRSSGAAFITVDAGRENTIILSPGANARTFASSDLEQVGLTPDDVVVLQAEIPVDMNLLALAWAKGAGARTVLNLAPARPIAPDVLSAVDVLVVNETEAGLVADVEAPRNLEDALALADRLRRLGPKRVVITLGSLGAVRASNEGAAHLPALDLGPVVDTTGAGDATVGVLAAALSLGFGFNEAVDHAMRAGALAVLGAGAASSYGLIDRIDVQDGKTGGGE